MNSLQIEYFLCLAEHKNFTTTAKVLYVSQPTISKQIASLEKEVGFALFFRSNRDVSLTPAGMVYLKLFTDMTKQYKKAEEHVQNMYNEKSNRLYLGCLDGMELSGLLNKILESLRENFPNVEYQLELHSPNNLIEYLNDGKLDAVITIDSFFSEDTNLSHNIFLNAKHTLYVPANSLHFLKSSLSLVNLSDETFLVLSPTVFPKSDYLFFTWCSENGITPKKIQYVPNIESQMLSVEAGLGVTIADTNFRLHTNPLIRGIELKTSHNIYLVWKKDNKNLLIPSFAKLASQINEFNKMK